MAIKECGRKESGKKIWNEKCKLTPKKNSKEQRSISLVNRLEKFVRGLKNFCLNKLLPRQASEFTAGNLEEHCKPPDEVQGQKSGETWKLVPPRQ